MRIFAVVHVRDCRARTRSGAGDAVEGANNYVRVALTEATSGKPVSTAVTRPYGCSVKYAY